MLFRSTTVKANGQLLVENGAALGPGSNTVVEAGAILKFGANPTTEIPITVNEALTLAGELDDIGLVSLTIITNTWAGDITLVGTAPIARIIDDVVFSGVISGNGFLTKQGGGTLTMGGSSANTYHGSVNVNAGEIGRAHV